MHVINRTFLKLALLPLNLYRRMGVDPVQLQAILTTKLTLDDRRPQPIAQATARQKKQVSMATLGTMAMSALMGVFFVAFFFIGSDKVTQLTFYFTFFFVLLSLTLITDFTSVLIDVRDNFILLPKPVSDKTIVVARLLHIFIHLCKIVLPMGLPGVVYFGYTTGVYGAVLLLLLIILLTAFAIFFINAVYIAILKFTTPQRFQSIITYVQILFAVVVYGSYQVLPRLLSNYTGGDFSLTTIKGIQFFPLYWMAATWQAAYTFHASLTGVAMAAAGILFPLAGIAVVVKFLAPSFNRKLALLSGTETGPKKNVAIRQVKRNTLAQFYSRLFTSGSAEKAGFLFTWKMTARSRDFKLKVYPSIGYMIVLVVVLLLKEKNRDWQQLRENPAALKGLLLSGIYFSVFLLAMAMNQVMYSDKYKASWLFYTSPIDKPGQIVTGAAKSVLVKFYLPVAVVLCTLAIVLAGPTVIPNLVLGLCNVVVIVALILAAGKHAFPFSMSQSTNAKAGSFLKSMFILLVAGMIGFVHYLVYAVMPVVVIMAVLSLLAAWLLFDSVRQMSWRKILSTYVEE